MPFTFTTTLSTSLSRNRLLAFTQLAFVALATWMAAALLMPSFPQLREHALERMAPYFGQEAVESLPLAETPSAPPPAEAHLTLAQYLANKYRQPVEQVLDIVEAAYHFGAQHTLSPLLLLAIMEQESSLLPTARSGYGAIGLMQVVPRFHEEKLNTDTPDVELTSVYGNVRVGSAIVAEYLRREKGNLQRALTRYSGKATRYYEKVARNQRALEKVLTPDPGPA